MVKIQVKFTGIIFILLYLTNSVADQSFYSVPLLSSELENKKFVLLMSDIELLRINKNTGKDTDAQLSIQAAMHIKTAFSRLMKAAGYKYTEYLPGFDESGHELRRSVSLQLLIKKSILAHFHSPLPSKHDFDWSIGTDGELLKSATGADYGLFLFFRAGINSASSSIEYQAGMVSLVDFNSGRTVWFNANTNLPGDVRESTRSLITITALLEGFPAIKANASQG